MTVIFKARMKCDTCGAQAVELHDNVTAARAYAQAHGWIDGKPGEDVCPMCQPEPPPPPSSNCRHCGLVHELGECPE